MQSILFDYGELLPLLKCHMTLKMASGTMFGGAGEKNKKTNCFLWPSGKALGR